MCYPECQAQRTTHNAQRTTHNAWPRTSGKGVEVNWIKVWIHRFLLPLGFPLAAAVLSVLIYAGKIGSSAALLLALLVVDVLWLLWMFSRFSNGQAKKAVRRYEKQVLGAYAPLLALLAHESAGAANEGGWVDDEQEYIWQKDDDWRYDPAYRNILGNIYHSSIDDFDDS